MSKGAVFAILAAAAAATAAAVVVMKKKHGKCTCSCCYDAGDLEDDMDCCECEVCGDVVNTEDIPAEEADDAETGEVTEDLPEDEEEAEPEA